MVGGAILVGEPTAPVGDAVGEAVGDAVGEADGDALGEALGDALGNEVPSVNPTVTISESEAVPLSLTKEVGSMVACSDAAETQRDAATRILKKEKAVMVS